MLEFYTWSSNARLLITFLFAVCVLFQSACLVLSRYRWQKTRLHTAESILEAAILLQIFCLSLLHGQVYMGFDQASVPPTGYGALRLATLAAVICAAVTVAFQRRKAWVLLAILSALVLLPAAEATLGKAYPQLYLLSLLFLLIRSMYLSLKRYREIKTGLSSLSVKEAIDNLHTGVLFGRPDGRIILMNARMQHLMTEISGTVHRNGHLFYEQMMQGSFSALQEGERLEGQDVFLLPNGTAWNFTKTAIHMQGKHYVQLTATDVSEHFRLTTKLKEQDAALRTKSEELKRTIAQLQILSHERGIQKAKMHAHDVLGERLTLLLRMVRGDQALDIHLLKSMSEGLLQQLRVGPDIPSPGEELSNLRRMFASIGVVVQVEGELPWMEAQTRLFVDIMREGVVNAVRHGFATKVQIRSFFEGGYWCLQIHNNGHAPKLPITEGGGISHMREKLMPKGGTLEIRCAPQFTIVATLPGEEL